jgi:hypothetical protein
MKKWDLLLELLKDSLKKNGNKEITIQHLINMMKMVDRKINDYDEEIDNTLEILDWNWM